MSQTLEHTAEFALLEAIAVALRDEFAQGEPMEEQPAYRDPRAAGQVNRAFRVVAAVVLRAIVLPGEQLGVLVSRALMPLARRRLAQSGHDDRDAEILLEIERNRDDWLAFLMLTTDSQIDHLLRSE
jgi:hypothetical protein